MNDSGYEGVSPDPLLMSDVAVDEAGRIDIDLACRVCGYNLRSALPDGRCPECGTAVGWSLMGDYLHFAEPTWVRTLAEGAMWLIVSVFVGIALSVISGMLEGSLATGSAGLLVTVGVELIPDLIAAVGYWKVTTPEPVERYGEPNRLRVWARWCTVLPSLSGIVTSPLIMMGPDYSAITMVAAIVVGVVGLIGFFTIFIYAARLARRASAFDLAKQTRTVMWGWVVIPLVTIAFGILAANAGGMSCVCFAGVAMLALAIWTIFLMFWYRRVFLAAAAEAEANWARRGQLDQAEFVP